jgi:hypothetical protein
MRKALWLVGVTMLAGCGDGQTPAQNQANASQTNAAAPAPSQPGPSASSEWQHLGADPDQNVGYAFDPRSVRRNGDLVSVRWREDHSQRRPPGAEREVIVEFEINCTARTARELSVEARLRDGNVERSAEPAAFTPIDPQSPLEYLRNRVCGQG